MNVFEGIMLGMQAGAGVYCTYNCLYYRALYWFAAMVLTFAVVKGLNQ
jgi:hypothetical protein